MIFAEFLRLFVYGFFGDCRRDLVFVYGCSAVRIVFCLFFGFFLCLYTGQHLIYIVLVVEVVLRKRFGFFTVFNGEAYGRDKVSFVLFKKLLCLIKGLARNIYTRNLRVCGKLKNLRSVGSFLSFAFAL